MSSTLALALQITALDAASATLRRIGGEVSNFAKKADEVKRHFTDAWIEVAKGAAAVHYGIGSLEGMVKPAADLEEAMLNVRSNLGNASMDARDLNTAMAKVADTADLIASKTRISKTDAAEIQNNLLKGGMSQASVDGKNGAGMATATLATLSGMDSGTAAENIVNIGASFHLGAQEYGALADNLVRVDDASATSIPKLVYGLQQSGASAHALGLSVKDTAIALGVLAPLGEMAGTSLNRFLSDSVAKTPKAQKQMIALGLATEEAGKFHNKFFENGKYVGYQRAIEMIRASFKGIKNDGDKLHAAQNIWGEEGGRAALVFMSSSQGFMEIGKAADASYSSAQKLEITMGGMNAQAERMRNNFSSLAATSLDPLKDSLKSLFDQLAGGFESLQKYIKSNPSLQSAASAGVGGAAALGGGYALWKLLKGGSGMVKGLRAMGGTAVGVAEGKVLQKAAGVTPVFVVNMPNGGGSTGGLLGDAATGVGAVAAGSKIKTAMTGLKLLTAAPTMTALASLGTGAMAVSAGLVSAAGLVGYGVGKVGMSFASDKFKDNIGGMMATILASFGNKEAQRALNINLHIDGKQVATVVNAQNTTQARRH